MSAAAAALDALAALVLVLVSSHNLVLAPLLAHRLDPLFIERTGEQLHLRAGVLAHTNGISLLVEHGLAMESSRMPRACAPGWGNGKRRRRTAPV